MSVSDPAIRLPPDLRQEFIQNEFNPVVGGTLVAENDLARVWFICLLPGERLGFHRHVLDYFWTALTVGSAESHVNGGPAQISHYTPGMTKRFRLQRGEYMLHDLKNIGDTLLLFNTVELLNSANVPL